MANDKIFYIHSKCCNAHWEQVYDADKKQVIFQCEKCGRVGFTASPVDLGQDIKCDCPDCKHNSDGTITGKKVIHFIVKSKNPDEKGTITGNLNSWEHLVQVIAYWEKQGKVVEFSVVKGGSNG